MLALVFVRSVHLHIGEVPAPIEASTKKTNVKRTTAAPPQPLAVAPRSNNLEKKQLGKLEDGGHVMSCTKEPQLDVLATIVIDCTGDCVLPRLTVDKKGNPDVEEFPAQNKDTTVVDIPFLRNGCMPDCAKNVA